MTKTRSTSTTAADDDGGRDAMPIFTPVLPPRLSSTSHASLVQWRKERHEYEETVRNRAKGGAEDKIVPIRTTFDEGLFRMWCRLRWQISIDDVTDEVILFEIDKIIYSVKNNNVPDVDDEMHEMLRMDLSESDVSERVIQYFKLCHDIIDDHGWQQFFSGDDGKQQLCRVLIGSIEPRALQEEVERTVRFQARAAKSDEVILHDLVLEKALDQEKNYQNQRRAKRDRSDGDSGRASKRGPSKSSTKKPRLTTERSGSSSKPPTKKTSSERAKVPPTPCPHCDEMHWLSECPTASDDQKAEIRRKLREQRANDGNKRVVARMKRLRECIPSQEKTVLLNEELAVPYCADTGADRTAISKQRVAQLHRSDTSIKVTPLDTPTVHVAVGDHEVISTHFVRLRLRLNTAAGPVGLQEPVDCLIIECDEPEFILGQDVLKSLGIDIDQQLEQLAGRDEGEDEGEEDLQDDLPSISLSSTDKDLQDAFEWIISSAFDQGFPSHLEQLLRAIVFKHDIWRLELGNDPPANVEALRIRLKDGARAVKSKPRPYPPAVRAFLHEFNEKLVELGWVYENPGSGWASPLCASKA